MSGKPCVDCPAGTKRPAPFPGPRCATHNRERKKLVSQRSHGLRIEATYGISADFYWQLYDHQGGRCYVCRKATGKSKRLAVDHDHRCCPGTKSCGRCVRGLACGRCNYDVLGKLGDEPELYDGIAAALRCPPAAQLRGTLST